MIGGKAFTKDGNGDEEYCYNSEFDEDLMARPFTSPPGTKVDIMSRKENPVVFIEIMAAGGRRLRDGSITLPENLGRLYFELRNDIAPVACANFLGLITGKNGYGRDGVCYHFKGVRIHRVIRNLYFQSGDLLDEQGNCSRSILNSGGLFRDENFILRHTGPGCLSMCNRGPDTNGSLFQVTFVENTDLDNKSVVFGCLTTDDSYECLSRINSYGTAHGEPLEELRIVDCGKVFPDTKV